MTFGSAPENKHTFAGSVIVPTSATLGRQMGVEPQPTGAHRLWQLRTPNVKSDDGIWLLLRLSHELEEQLRTRQQKIFMRTWECRSADICARALNARQCIILVNNDPNTLSSVKPHKKHTNITPTALFGPLPYRGRRRAIPCTYNAHLFQRRFVFLAPRYFNSAPVRYFGTEAFARSLSGGNDVGTELRVVAGGGGLVAANMSICYASI